MALGSAAAFGTLAILGKFAYGTGMTVVQVLVFRFLLAAAGMFVLAACVGGNPFRIDRKKLLTLLTLGAMMYGGVTFLFFTALKRLPASLVELILYAYPACVVLAGWLLLHRVMARGLLLVLPVSFLGVALLIGWVKFEFNSALLAALALPVANALYFFVAEFVMRGEDARRAGAFLMLGAAIFWLAVSAVSGELTPPPGALAWVFIAGLAIVPSMLGVPLLMAALTRIPSERAALLSMFEPIVTVLLALVLLGERLAWTQILGAILVLGSAAILQWPARKLKKCVA